MNIWDPEEFPSSVEEEWKNNNDLYVESDFKMEEKEFKTGKVIDKLDMLIGLR